MLIPLADGDPVVDPSAWVAPNATLSGAVVVRERAGVFYGAVLRADLAEIEIGEESNVQDNAVFHTGFGERVRIGARVSVGHSAIIHGSTVGELSLIGMGAIIMNGCEIGAESLIGAGSLLPERMIVPPRSLVLGSPARIRRVLTAGEIAELHTHPLTYAALIDKHRAATQAMT